jgi:hypothetical protein|tara:strand:- start:960 stop:1190 length:231 start_codon:yes stop_codon:yes gene_type:complete
MTSSNDTALKVGDIVEHSTQHEDYPEPQGTGLLTRLNKIGSRPEWNLWKVKFFNGQTFEILEEYLKKIQGAVDFEK